MNLDGSATLSGTPEQVWAVITDPEVLARTIPGCVSLTQNGEDSYEMVVSVGVGAVRGTYAGEVRLADKQHPSSYVMHASGSGGPGSVRATVTLELSEAEGGTALTYSADAVVGGAVAGVGQRMITGVAKRLAGQYFSAVDAELTGTAAAARQPVNADVTPSAAAVSDTAVSTGAPAAAIGQSTSADQTVPSGQAAPGRTFAPPAPASGAWVPGEAKPMLIGAAGGGLLTLLGVWVGYLMGRRS